MENSEEIEESVPEIDRISLQNGIIEYVDQPEQEIIELGNESDNSNDDLIDCPEFKCECAENFICYHCTNLLKKCKNYEKFIVLNPNIKKIYDKEYHLNYTKQMEFPEYDKKVCHNNIKNLLYIVYKINGRINKSIALFSMYDYVLRNGKFLKENKNFCMLALKRAQEAFDLNVFQDVLEESGIDEYEYKKKLSQIISENLENLESLWKKKQEKAT